MCVALVARVLNLFLFAWFVVGLVWAVSSLSAPRMCGVELPFTWITMLVLLLVEMAVMMAGTMLCLCSCLVVVSRMLIMSRDNVRSPQRDGASEEEISSNTEVTEYSADDFPDQEDAKCVVCLGEYEEGDQLRKLQCNHVFHVECVDEWLKRHKTCPLCVRSIDT
jgi:hypothetical protein